MSRVKNIALILYLIWFISFVANVNGVYGSVALSYLIFFQLFVPGFILNAIFGFLNKPLTELILYSFVLSYLIYLIAAIPTFFVDVDWGIFTLINVVLYLSILVLFLVKIFRGLNIQWDVKNPNEIFVVILALIVAVSFSYINFRSDASQYNNRIVSSIQAENVQSTYSTKWLIDGDRVYSKNVSEFHHDYKAYFSFLALPIKYSVIDQRYGWFIFSKFFIFLSILAAYSLGKKLYGYKFGHLSLFFFLGAVLVLGLYNGGVNISTSGYLFAQISYPRGVAGSVFMIVFYMSLIDAIKKSDDIKLLLSGLILLSIFTVSTLDFYWASLNTFIFSIIVLFKANVISDVKGYCHSINGCIKYNAVIALPSALLLLLLIMFTNYWQEGINFQSTFEEKYPGFNSDIYKLNVISYIQKFIDRSGSVYIFVLFMFSIFVVKNMVKTDSVSSIFILSNMLLYLVFKNNISHNLLIDYDLRMISTRIDGWLLFYIYCSFISYYFFEKAMVQKELKNNKQNLLIFSKDYFFSVNKIVNYKKITNNQFIMSVTMLFYDTFNKIKSYTFTVNYFLLKDIWKLSIATVMIVLAFSLDNKFTHDLRIRKNAGHDFLSSTEYLKHIIDDRGYKELSVLTNYKTAVDAFAFLNAATIQYREEYYWPLNIALGRKDVERLFYYPDEDSIFLDQYKASKNVKEFLNVRGLDENEFLNFRIKGGKIINIINASLFDYIIIPTRKTRYAGKVDNQEDFEKAIRFYNDLSDYRLVYNDKYYYVYEHIDV